MLNINAVSCLSLPPCGLTTMGNLKHFRVETAQSCPAQLNERQQISVRFLCEYCCLESNAENVMSDQFLSQEVL